MTIPRLTQRFFRLQGHAIDPSRLYAVQWVLGVFGIFWAVLAGAFISMGGASHLKGELYQPLIATFGDYRIIGLVSIIGGLIGIIGLGFDLRGASIASSVICVVWNGLFAAWVIPANWTVPGGGNLVGIYLLWPVIFYLLRITLLISAPTGDAMKLR